MFARFAPRYVYLCFGAIVGAAGPVRVILISEVLFCGSVLGDRNPDMLGDSFGRDRG